MNRSAFRRFEFFDVDTIAEDMTTTLGSAPTCATAEGGMLIFGDSTGNIFISDRNFHISERKHKVFRNEVRGVSYLFDPTNHSRQYIIAIGDDGAEDSNAKLYLIKVFSATDMSRPIQVLNATAGDSVLTSFAVLSDATQIAVGFNTGTVLLFSGMFLKETAQGRPPAPIALLPRHKYPVSGLHFCELTLSKNHERRIRLFAVFDTSGAEEEGSSPQRPPEPSITGEDPSAAGLLVFDTSVVLNASGTAFASTARHPPRVLDERGAAAKCSSLLKGTSELVVGRGEAVYNYSVEDRGGALAIFGEKLCVSAVGRYTLVVSVDEKPSAPAPIVSSSNASGASTPVNAGRDAQPPPPPVDSKPRKPNVNIYDLKNKIICGTTKKYQLPVGEKIMFALHDGGCAYLVTSSWSLIRFREKDTGRKLDMLLQYSKPPLYSLAIMVAAEEQVETAEIMKLYKSYGDHLYGQNDFDASIVQYCHTIGYIPPSYVVMKFLDPYRISNLITYLEKLHDKGLAGKDHITLLLTCYTKIKDEGRLKELLDGLAAQKTVAVKGDFNKNALSDTAAAAAAGQAAVFDPQQAITTLNAAGYSDYALRIAAKHHQHAAYLSIQLGKSPAQVDDALGYIAYLVFSPGITTEALTATLKKHGRQLLKSRAKAFTALLIKLCVGDYAALLPVPGGSASTTVGAKSMIQTAGGTAEAIRALSSLLGEDIQLPTYSNVSVVDLLPLYSDDRDSLLVLLEGVDDAGKGRMMPPKVSTTLLELYLHNYSVAKEKLVAQGSSAREMDAALQPHEQNIMRILDGACATYDSAHALLLVHSFGFDRGARLLLEKSQSVELVMAMLIEGGDSREVFKVLRREGTKDPELFIQVLTYFVNATMEHHGKHDHGARRGKGGAKASSSSAAGAGRDRDSDDSDHDHSDAESNESDDDHDSDDDEDEEARWDDVVEVMHLIEKESILSPVQVVTILSLNPNLPLQIAQKYILKTLTDLTDSIAQGEQLVRGSLTNLEGINQSHAAINEARLAKAAKAQEKALALRTRQQYRHSNNHYDDDEDDDEDEEEEETEEDIRVMEEREQERWNNIRKAQLACSVEHEAFYKELELSADGFSTVAGFFGRSIINP